MIFLFHMHMAIVSAAASTILRSSQISIYGSLGLAGLLILIFGRLKDMENRLWRKKGGRIEKEMGKVKRE